jgi:CRP/FNR family transcriptional regulator, anaerobic regulatory protein
VNIAAPVSCTACKARHFASCQSLTGSGLDAIAGLKAGDRRLAAADHIYREGDIIEDVFILVDGWVLLYHMLEDGRRQILEILLPGAFFGLQPEFKAAMSHSAVCATAVKVSVFSRQHLMNKFHDRPELALRVMIMCARDRLALYQSLTNLGRRTARERVAHLFVELDHRLRARQPGVVSALPLTQEQIGDLMGLSKVHVNRILQDWRQQHLVDVGRGLIRIQRPAKLADIAGLGAEEKALRRTA